MLPNARLAAEGRSPWLAERVRAFERRCREAGVPVTVQRRLILETVLMRDDHPTAEQVHDALAARVRGISRATVYRTLEFLVQLGAIGRVHHRGTASRFDPNPEHHHHLVCLRCDRLTDYHDARLDGLPLPDGAAHGFQAVDYSIHFTGICPDCQDAADPANA